MSELLSGGGEFELVYEGPADESPDTLRRLKGVFIADLELSVDEVQHILAHAPLAIKAAADSKSLENYYRTLKSAGAKVLIVRKKLDADSPGLEEAEDLIQQALADPATLEADRAAQEEEIEIEFQFEDDLEVESEEPTASVEKTGKVPVDDDDEPLLGAAYKQGLSGAANPKTTEPSAQAPETTAQDDAPLFKFVDTSTLSVPKEEAETLPLITSPAGTEEALSREDEDLGSHLSEISKSLFEIADHDRPPKDPSAYSLDELEISFEDNSPATPAPPKNTPAPLDLKLQAEPVPERMPATAAGSSETKPISPPPPFSMASPSPAQPQPSSSTPPAVAKPTPVEIPESELGFTPISREEVARRRKPGFNWDIVAWIAGGAIVLLLGNYLYFSSRDPQVSEEQVAHLKAASQLANKALEDEDPLGIKTLRYAPNVAHGSKKSGDISVDWKITIIDNKPDAISIILTTPEPPPRTKEQIVRQDPGRPWLSKIELLALPLTFDGKEKFTAQGPAKAFITYADQKFRTIANASVTGNFHDVDRTASGNIQITLENPGEVEREHHGDGFEVSSLDNKKFKLTAKASF